MDKNLATVTLKKSGKILRRNKQRQNVKTEKKSQGDYKISTPWYNYYHFEFEMAI